MRLKKSVADLRRQVAALELSGTNSELVKKVAPVVWPVKATEEATQKAATLRPTSKSVGRLRARRG